MSDGVIIFQLLQLSKMKKHLIIMVLSSMSSPARLSSDELSLSPFCCGSIERKQCRGFLDMKGTISFHCLCNLFHCS